MCSKLSGFANGKVCCCEPEDMNAEDPCACPAPTLPLTVCCSIEQNQDGDSPGKRLVNVDAMEEMCFYAKDPCDYDYYQVCDCCGMITKWDSGSQECCKPAKYARRQRFTFKDEKSGCIPPQPPWPFKHEALCCPPPCAPEGANCCCKGGSCVAEGEAVEGLPCQSGVYYYSRTENKLVLQTRDVDNATPPATQQCCYEDTTENDQCERPQIIQPLIMPNGGSCCAPPCNTCPAPCSGPCYPPPCCPPCGGPCCGPSCPPCCGPCCPPCGGPCCGPSCSPCCGPCCPPCGGACCGPCCQPCGGPCYGPNCPPCGGACCGSSCPPCCVPCCPPCCYPPPWCCNPCCSPPVNCCAFPPYSNPCCGPPPRCCPYPVNNNVCCPPPQPPPAPQTTVIPLCIPINPPAACGGCKNYNETVIDLKRMC